MSIIKGFWDATGGNPNYPSAIFSEFVKMIANGIISGFKNNMVSTKTNSLEITIDSGGVCSEGRWLIQDQDADTPGHTPYTVTLDAAGSGYMRYDRIVIRINSTNQTIDFYTIQGNEVVSNPVIPSIKTIDTSPTEWDVPIGTYKIETGDITQVIDDRVLGGAYANPTFTNMIVSALAFLVSAGEKIYFNDEKTAYLWFDATDGRIWAKYPGKDPLPIMLGTSGTSSSAPSPVDEWPKDAVYMDI